MRTKNLAIVLALGTTFVTSCSMMNSNADQQPETVSNYSADGTAINQKPKVTPEEVARFAPNWPEASQAATKEMLEKYGQPNESTASSLVWNSIQPYKRIVVYREEALHRFPILHKDVIEHVINFRVPAEKATELTKFDGSISFNRTVGELAVRGDKEAMNVLALNLASDIIEGRRDFLSAREEFSRRTVDLLNGNKTAQTENLQFIAQSWTGDADQSSKISFAQAAEVKPLPPKAPMPKSRFNRSPAPVLPRK